MSSGSKYHRAIRGITPNTGATVDVYAVLVAFDVRCPARQHAIKKLLCAGIRGKGDAVQDLTEARDALDRAIAMERDVLGELRPDLAPNQEAGGDVRMYTVPCAVCSRWVPYTEGEDPPHLCSEHRPESVSKPPQGSLMQIVCSSCKWASLYTGNRPSVCPRCGCAV